jgi:multicomponent Na+:H+ antiporter subunit E
MNAFLINIVLALVWAGLLGRFDAVNLVLGFVVAYVALWLVRPIVGVAYHRRLVNAASFVVFFMRELVISTFRVAREVLALTPRRRPAIIAFPLDARTDFEITLFANLMTLTPGTLALDVSEDRSILFIHCMFVDDADRIRREIKDGFERRVLELTR